MDNYISLVTGMEMDVPWDRPMDVPEYTDHEMGEWRLKLQPMPPLVRGYYNDIHVPPHRVNPVLTYGDEGVWMSVSPMELESQAPHVHFATGHTVIAGLGLGVLLYNVLRKDDVHSVTVLENSMEIIQMLQQVVNLQEWTGDKNLRIIHTDAKTWETDRRVDFLAVDIFQRMMCRTNLATLKRMNRNIKPDMIAGWTTELEFVDWCRQNMILPDYATDEHYVQFVDEVDLPLIYWPGIADYCFTVAHHTAMY